jgi:hypothetical protein
MPSLQGFIENLETHTRSTLQEEGEGHESFEESRLFGIKIDILLPRHMPICKGSIVFDIAPHFLL